MTQIIITVPNQCLGKKFRSVSLLTRKLRKTNTVVYNNCHQTETTFRLDMAMTLIGESRFTTSAYEMAEESLSDSIIDRPKYTNLKRTTRRTTRSTLFSPGSSVEKANDLSFTILCSVTMTPEKYRYERAAAVGKNVNLKERTDRGIGTWESEKPVLCNKSLALTFKK